VQFAALEADAAWDDAERRPKARIDGAAAAADVEATAMVELVEERVGVLVPESWAAERRAAAERWQQVELPVAWRRLAWVEEISTELQQCTGCARYTPGSMELNRRPVFFARLASFARPASRADGAKEAGLRLCLACHCLVMALKAEQAQLERRLAREVALLRGNMRRRAPARIS
jgi:hypothetical protein